MNDIKIIDNFLTGNDLSLLKNLIFSPNFDWIYNDIVVDDNDLTCEQKYNYQFVHLFYHDHRPVGGVDIFRTNLQILDIFMKKFQPLFVYRMKANLLTRTEKKVYHGMHKDYHHPFTPNFSVKTALYYLNTNDGVTAFEDGTEIQSVENRIVIFDANLNHTGTTCTDQKTRCVINFVYVPFEK